jgi:hypothetical protein
METIGVIRRKVTQKEKYVGLSASTAGQIQPKIDTEIRKFVDKITRLVAQDKAVLFDSASPAKDYFTDALSVYKRVLGNIEKNDFCRICKRNIPPRYSFRGLGHYDIQHAMNARDSSASELFSFDHSFEDLQKYSPDFNSLKITVL